MLELSLHILDIVENSLTAGASLVEIRLVEDRNRNLLEIDIRDDGRGIPPERVQKVLDPFYTTRTTRRVGLGLALFRDAARQCGGDFTVESKEGEGTLVRAWFEWDHIDRAPLGDMAGTLQGLIVGNADVDFHYLHEVDGQVFEMDTRNIRKQLGGVPLNHPEVIRFLNEAIREGEKGLYQKGR